MNYDEDYIVHHERLKMKWLRYLGKAKKSMNIVMALFPLVALIAMGYVLKEDSVC